MYVRAVLGTGSRRSQHPQAAMLPAMIASSLLPPCGPWGSNPAHHGWWQVPLPTGPPCRPLLHVPNVSISELNTIIQYMIING